MNESFLKAAALLERLEQAGFEAYFVGGSVRDYIMNKEIHDIDIATSATPTEIKKIFKKTIDVGIEHGTVLVLFSGTPYEVTTFRAESVYIDNRYPDNVEFIRSLTDDLERRDFTMNAIAMTRTGELIDPFKGREAIKDKKIITVGKAGDRFTEDALRIMRAVRFVSELQFSMAEETKLALEKYSNLLSNISIERITTEFEKLLVGPGVKDGISLLVDTNLHEFLPGLSKKGDKLLELRQYNLHELSLTERWVLLLYCCEIEPQASKSFLKKWKLSNKQIKAINHLLTILNLRLQGDWTERMLYDAGRENVQKIERLSCVIKKTDICYLKDIIEMYSDLPIYSREDLSVNGSLLMKWLNRRGGPWLSKLLTEIENRVLTSEILNEEKSIKKWVMKWDNS